MTYPLARSTDRSRARRGWRAVATVQVFGAGMLFGCMAFAQADEPADVQDAAAADGSGVVVLGEASAADQAALLIRAMSKALRTLDYEGTFVHLAGDNLTSLVIAHTNDASGERERLSALDGEAREVFRNDSLVTCIWPESRSVVVTDSKQRNSLPTIDASLVDNEHYALAMRDDDRVAGLATHVVEVMPRDALRYGYRFWIDQQTRMLLRSMLLDEHRRPLEQVLFTSIRYPDSIAPERFEIAGEGASWNWVRSQLAARTATGAAAGSELDPDADGAERSPLDGPGIESRIAFDTLPDGYHEMATIRSPMPELARPVSQVMLSDGMASVSVYVEHVPLQDQQGGALGLSRMGAMNAFGLSLADAFVTVVGEVPAETVERIARATRVLAR